MCVKLCIESCIKTDQQELPCNKQGIELERRNHILVTFLISSTCTLALLNLFNNFFSDVICYGSAIESLKRPNVLKLKSS